MIVLETGRNRDYFVNLSTITRIASIGLLLNIVSGKPMMKSIKISAHRRSGTSSGCSYLYSLCLLAVTP